MRERRLEGVCVAVLAADGFEQMEVTVPMRALRREGAEVRIVSLRPGRIRGMNFLWRGRKLPVDDTVFKARPEHYGALLLPGGFVNPDLLRQSEHALEFVRQMEQLGRPLATLCHGPEVLISAGLVRGRRLTSWPGIADDVRNAGGKWENAPVVKDGRWVASRSPLDLPAFIEETIRLFAAEAPRSLPLPARPVRWVAAASRAAGLGLVGAGALGLGAALREARRRPARGARLLRDLGFATMAGAGIAWMIDRARSEGRVELVEDAAVEEEIVIGREGIDPWPAR
jgi:protease I